MNIQKGKIMSCKNSFVIFLFIIISLFVINKPANAYNEESVRFIMLDITLGDTYYYFSKHINEPDPAEAIKRWDNGIRVTNAGQFERKQVNGEWRHTYRGTETKVNVTDIRLSTDGDDRRPPAPTKGPTPQIKNPGSQDDGGMLCGTEQQKPILILRFEVVDAESRTPIPGASIKTSGSGEHEMSWRADSRGVAVLVACDERCIPSSGVLEVTARGYNYHTEQIGRDSFSKQINNRRIFLEGHQHNWTNSSQFPSTQELINKVRAGRYRIGIERIPSGMGFDWINYAPSLFEYRIEMTRIR
jgi:hypothetical protein